MERATARVGLDGNDGLNSEDEEEMERMKEKTLGIYSAIDELVPNPPFLICQE